jgi:hypothetical protein
MVFSYGKINIRNLIVGFISLFSAFMVAYYVQSDNENKFENFGDYINYFLDKFTFLYILIIFTFIFYNIFGFLVDNRQTIKKEFSSRGKIFMDRSLGPDFVNRSIKGGRTATNKIYDYTGRAYNYLRPNKRINPEYTVQPLYAPTSNELQRRVMSSTSGANNWAALRGRDFYNPIN